MTTKTPAPPLNGTRSPPTAWPTRTTAKAAPPT